MAGRHVRSIEWLNQKKNQSMMETEWFSNRFHLDRDDKGPESEEEVWEGDDSDETPDKQPVVRVRREKHLGPLVSVKSN